MPLYTRIVQVSAQTAETSAVRSLVAVDEQVVVEATVFIDPASNGEVSAVLLDGERQIIPEPSGDAIAKPGETTVKNLRHVLPGTPSDVEVKVWAPDADFDHEVIVQFETAEPEEIGQLDRLLDAFSPTDVSGQD